MAILFFAWGCGTKTPEVRGLNRRREADGSMPVHAQHERVKVGEANPSTSTKKYNRRMAILFFAWGCGTKTPE